MGAVASFVEDVVGGAVEAVGDVVEDVGSAVIDNVVKPVAKAVENTLDQAARDPIGTIAKIGTAIVAPELLPLVNAGDALANGASLDQALVSAGTSYVTGQATAGIAPEVATSTGSDIFGSTAQGAASGALSSVLRGGDPLQGAITGGLYGGANKALDVGATAVNQALNTPEDASILNYRVPDSILGDYAGTSDTGGEFNLDQIKANAASVDQPVDYSLSSATPTTDMTPGGLGLDPNSSGIGLTMDSITGRAPSLTSMGGGQGLTMPVEGGTLSAAGFTDANALPALGDPSSFINNPEVTGQPVTPIPTCAFNVDAPSLQALRSMTGSPFQRQRALGLAFNPGCSGVPWLDTRAQMLAGQAPVETPTGGVSGLGGAVPPTSIPMIPESRIQPDAVPTFHAFTPELRGILAERGYGAFASGGGVQNFADGSSATFCQTYGLSSQYTPKFYSVKCNMLTSPAAKRSPLALAQLKQLQPHIATSGNLGGMAKGGLPAKYQEAAPEGHNPEFITGVTGYYAGGRGTGQSDDIPAMLHDGDYVMDAEAVSAFGDGSSKAGNEVLMRFMHQVPHAKRVGTGKPVPAKIADGEVVFPESFVTALGGGDNKRGARMLDEMRHRLREHKRSAPNSKIPPKAKSPLDYLKGVKG